MTDMKRMVQVSMTEEEFVVMETGLAMLLCVIEGDDENAKIGTALLLMSIGLGPVETLLGKAIALHESMSAVRNAS